MRRPTPRPWWLLLALILVVATSACSESSDSGAEAEGDLELLVSGAAEPQAAGPDQLALAMDPRYAEGIAKGQAKAAVLWPGADWRGMGLKAAIFAPRPVIPWLHAAVAL